MFWFYVMAWWLSGLCIVYLINKRTVEFTKATLTYSDVGVVFFLSFMGPVVLLVMLIVFGDTKVFKDVNDKDGH